MKGYEGSSWSFPKGKFDEAEKSSACVQKRSGANRSKELCKNPLPQVANRSRGANRSKELCNDPLTEVANRSQELCSSSLPEVANRLKELCSLKELCISPLPEVANRSKELCSSLRSTLQLPALNRFVFPPMSASFRLRNQPHMMQHIIYAPPSAGAFKPTSCSTTSMPLFPPALSSTHHAVHHPCPSFRLRFQQHIMQYIVLAPPSACAFKHT